MKRILCILSAAIMLLSVFGCAVSQTVTPQSIKKVGVLKVGVKDDVPNFGYFNINTNQYEGMEIDLARLIARDLTGDGTNVEFTSVTTNTRGPMLDNGDVDIIIATFTITDERKLLYNFSAPYYTDSIGIMVKNDSGITDTSDLNGKTIGVVQAAPTKDALQPVVSKINVSFSQYPSAREAKAALDSGITDAFAIGCSILNGYLDDTTMILPNKYSPQPLGVATKLGNKVLATYINNLINKWLQDGTIETLTSKYNI